MKLLSIISLILAALLFAKPGFAADKRVEINLTTQHLYAFEGNEKKYDIIISSGKRWWPTPTGTFKPWGKFRFERMIGGSRALGTYYDLPNVPYTIYFYKGYAIHGTYWHSNFGYPMSHGCVNVSIENSKLLYEFIDFNTPIIIYGTTPL